MMKWQDRAKSPAWALIRHVANGGWKPALLGSCLVLLLGAAPVTPQTTMPSGYGSQGVVYPPGIPFNQTPPRTVELIAQALRRAKLPSDQAHYLHELGVTRMKQAAPFVATYLDNSDPTLRAVAAGAAGIIADPSLANGVNKLLGDSDPVVRRAALTASLLLTDDQAAKSQIIARMLKDEQPSVVIDALSLANASDAVQIAVLLAAARPPIAAEAIKTLARVHAVAQASVIAPFLKSDDLPVQSAAITAVGQLGDASQLPTIIPLLHAASPSIRRDAMIAFVQLAPEWQQHKVAMEVLASDPDPTVREAACGTFARYPLASSVDLLVKQLSDPYIPLHDAARAALSHTASDAMTADIISHAVALLHQDNQRRKEDGSYLLGHYRSEAALQDHIALIHGYPSGDTGPVDWDLYTQAVRSLGRIGNIKAGPPLIPLLAVAPITMGELMNSRVSLDAEEAALVTVGQLKFTDALPQVWRIVNGDGQIEPKNMRGAAVWALGALTSSNDPKSNEAFIGIVAGFKSDSPSAVFEASKWLGLRHVAAAADSLKIAAAQETDPLARFTAHWAYQKITDTTISYTPPNIPYTPETSIVDLTGSDKP